MQEQIHLCIVYECLIGRVTSLNAKYRAAVFNMSVHRGDRLCPLQALLLLYIYLISLPLLTLLHYYGIIHTLAYLLLHTVLHIFFPHLVF